MGRKRTGTVYEKDGALWYSFLKRDGKRHTRRVPLLPDGRTATRDQARAYLAEAVRRYDTGLWDPDAPTAPAPAPPPPTPTVETYATRWAAELTHGSAYNEQVFVRLHVVGTELGATKLTEVEPQHVVAWVRALLSKPSEKGGVLAPLTIRGFFKYLTRLFNDAVLSRAISATPCVLPKGTLPAAMDKIPGARRGWKPLRDEIEQLISDVRVPADRRVLWSILFFTGDRAGEAFALRWSDLEARQPLACLHVERAWSRMRKGFKEPKTKVAREVPVHPVLAAVLAEWKLSGWEACYGRTPKPEDLIVPTAALAPRTTSVALRHLNADAVRLGLGKRRLHGFRHAFISIAVDDGASQDLLAKITHRRPPRSAFDVYVDVAWSTLCAEVAKIKVRRRADVLPLWKVAAGGEVSEEGSATNIATSHPTTIGNAVKQGPSQNMCSPVRTEHQNRATHDPAGIQGNLYGDDRSKAAQNATNGTDSATDSATDSPSEPALGAHTGEAFAQLWFDRALLEELRSTEVAS